MVNLVYWWNKTYEIYTVLHFQKELKAMEKRRRSTAAGTHRTKASVLQEVQPVERLSMMVQRRKLQYFDHVIRAIN